jgi:hypothetical protein
MCDPNIPRSTFLSKLEGELKNVQNNKTCIIERYDDNYNRYKQKHFFTLEVGNRVYSHKSKLNYVVCSVDVNYDYIKHMSATIRRVNTLGDFLDENEIKIRLLEPYCVTDMSYWTFDDNFVNNVKMCENLIYPGICLYDNGPNIINMDSMYLKYELDDNIPNLSTIVFVETLFRVDLYKICQLDERNITLESIKEECEIPCLKKLQITKDPLNLWIIENKYINTFRFVKQISV